MVCRPALNPLSHTSQGKNILVSIEMYYKVVPEVYMMLLTNVTPIENIPVKGKNETKLYIFLCTIYM